MIIEFVLFENEDLARECLIEIYSLFLYNRMELQRMTYLKRIGRAPGTKNVICRFWMEGRCNRNPCRFEHSLPLSNIHTKTSRLPLGLLENVPRKSPKMSLVSKPCDTVGFGNGAAKKRPYNSLSNKVEIPKCSSENSSLLKDVIASEDGSSQNISNNGKEDFKRKRPNPKNGPMSTIVSDGSKDEDAKEISGSATIAADLKKTKVVKSDPCNSMVLATENHDPGNRTSKKTAEKVCKHWMSGSCEKGDGCLYLHSRILGEGFSMLAELRGHNQAISGITLPSGSGKLYSGSSDGTVQIWDCHTGQSARVINLSNKIGSLISEGPWVFAGMPNLVKAMNIETAADYDLNGPVGQVYALAVASDMLFSGAQDGAIVVWKGSRENPCPFQLETSLNGHSGAVICFAVEARTLYSGSVDGTIRVWNLETLQCLQTLNGHTDAVMSLVCWNGYLMSCSLDRTIKVWFPAEGSNFETIYTHKEEHGALSLCGINDAENKPILLCSCNDNSVRLYEIPTFKERGRLFSKEEVRTIQMGPSRLFFTGDGTGLVTVWKMAERKVEASQKSPSEAEKGLQPNCTLEST